MLTKHKIFDKTLWISTVLSVSLALFSTVLTAIYSLLNVFMSPTTAINGPIGLYLWNAISTLAHILAIVLFSLEFHMYIQKNVLTKDEQESGWVSTNRADLSWSFYILITSACLITLNFALIYAVVRLKRSFMQLKNYYETNMNLLNADNGVLISCGRSLNDLRPHDYYFSHQQSQQPQQNPYDNADRVVEYHHIVAEPNLNIHELHVGVGQLSSEHPFGSRNNELRTSKKLKRIVDFIY
jgi:hypothetical protein